MPPRSASIDISLRKWQIFQMKISKPFQGLVIGTLLLTGVVGILGFVHSAALLDPGKERCFRSVIHASWPKWIGCAMAAHENLAGGLLGGAGALFAAWLAWVGLQKQMRSAEDIVQRQIRSAEDARTQSHVDYKIAAAIAIRDTVDALASILAAVKRAKLITSVAQQPALDRAIKVFQANAITAVSDPLMAEIAKNLGPSDLRHFLSVVRRMKVFLNFFDSTRSPIPDRAKRLDFQEQELMDIRCYIHDFNEDLSRAFDEIGEVPAGTARIKLPDH
jgi:hypothetical protein